MAAAFFAAAFLARRGCFVFFPPDDLLLEASVGAVVVAEVAGSVVGARSEDEAGVALGWVFAAPLRDEPLEGADVSGAGASMAGASIAALAPASPTTLTRD